MDAVAGKLVGKLGQNAWAQVYDFTPEGEEKLSKRGRLVAVVGMEASEGTEQVEMVQAGREVLARLHELYYGEETGEAFIVLKNAIGSVRREFEGVEIGGVVLAGEFVYIVAGGGVGVWVSRPAEGENQAEKQGWLVRAEEEREKEAAFSGRGEESEMVVLGNKSFFSGVPDGLLRAAVATAGEEMEAAVDMLAAVQRGSERKGGEAGVIVKIQKINDKLSVTEKEEEKEAEEEKAPEESRIEEKKEARWVFLKRKLEGVRGRIYIRHGDKQEQRKRMMYLGVFFLAVLLLMAGMGQLWLRQKTQKESLQETQIEKLVFDFNEAKAMIALNPSRSRQLLGEIKNGLGQLKPEGVKDSRIAGINAEWDQVWQEAAGIITAELNELVDLSLVREGMKGEKIALEEGKLVVLDKTGGRLVEVDQKSGSGKVIAGGEGWKGAVLVATYPDKIFVLAEKGISEVGDAKVKVEADEGWGNIADMKVFAGNIYLLDEGSGQIWRYAAKTGGYGLRQPWLADGEGGEKLKGVMSMAIDGSIWMVKPGELIKFTRGVNDGLAIEGMDKPWGEKAVVFTTDESEKVYILDPQNKRIVILGKDGKYEKQWVNDGLEKMADLAADEKGGWMYGLGEGKIWKIKI